MAKAEKIWKKAGGIRNPSAIYASMVTLCFGKTLVVWDKPVWNMPSVTQMGNIPLKSFHSSTSESVHSSQGLVKSTRREALWLDPQHAWIKGNARPDKTAAACRPSVQPELQHSGSVGVDEKTCSELCNKGKLRDSVKMLHLLVQQGSYVSTSFFFRVLKRCILEKDLVLGRRVHALTIESGYESDKFLGNHMICMYASHGLLDEATQVFTNVSKPDAYMWASIILAHVKHGQPSQAIRLYQQMRQLSMKPDNHIFVAILKACASAEDLAFGKYVHADFLESAVEPGDLYADNCLVDMYVKCGSLLEARKVFDDLRNRDVMTWNAMIGGYVQHKLYQEALSLSGSMKHECMNLANSVTFVYLLQACKGAVASTVGKQLHAEIKQRGLEGDVVVGSCLVDMYVKCGTIDDARRVFDSLPGKDVVTWTAMMAGYVNHGLGQEALSLHASMQQENVAPNHFTFSCLLQACASLGAVNHGKQVHAQIQERGLESDVVVGSCLVEMYAKCGSLVDARKVFELMPSRDVVTWTALLNGYAQHCDGKTAMKCFEEMLQRGVKPDAAIFICLLVACSHEGLVNEGHKYFKLMVDDHGIAPTLQHYNCMVDLFGRSGHLDDAENMLQTMVFRDNVVGWMSLLTACKSYGDVERGKRCFDCIVKMEPENAPAYVLLGHLYANAGRWGDAHKIENLRRSAGAKKKPAKACIEVKNRVHEFTVGEERGDTSSKLKSVNLRLKEDGGHVPQTVLVFRAVSEGEKEDALCGHAEKLALAYGLLNTPNGTSLLVTKNLRMCNDCHSGTKIMSRLESREIIVRDAHRVHHFVDGSCSCGDRH